MRSRLAASLWAASFAAAFLALNASPAADIQPAAKRKPAEPKAQPVATMAVAAST